MSSTQMKLILTQEVTGLGAPGDVVEVGRRLRPQLPRAARARHALDPRGGEADRPDHAGQGGP